MTRDIKYINYCNITVAVGFAGLTGCGVTLLTYPTRLELFNPAPAGTIWSAGTSVQCAGYWIATWVAPASANVQQRCVVFVDSSALFCLGSIFAGQTTTFNTRRWDVNLRWCLRQISWPKMAILFPSPGTSWLSWVWRPLMKQQLYWIRVYGLNDMMYHLVIQHTVAAIEHCHLWWIFRVNGDFP